MAKIKLMFWFDTEDYITDEAEEAFLGLLNLLDSKNIPGTFKIVGEKARRLQENNRTDILKKLSRHEVGYHTDLHSQPPTVSEYLEPYDFKAGAVEFKRREQVGLDDLTRITGMRSMCYGQAGYSWAPQSFPVLKNWDIPVYLDIHDQISLNQRPFWYGGLLNFAELQSSMRMELEENGLETAKQQFDEVCAQFSEDEVGFVSIYYHPCEFSSIGFWDGYNFSRGRNTPRGQWQPAPLRPEGEMEHYLSLLGEFLDYTLSKENVEYITSEQAFALEISDQSALKPNDVRAIAANVGASLNFQVHDSYSLSAADLHSVFCRYVLGQPLEAELIYGPENAVSSDPVHSVRVADIKQAIAVEYPRVFEYKQLPDYFTAAGHRLNPIDLTCTLASIIERGLDDGDTVEIVRGKLETETHAKDTELWGPRWVIFPEDLKVPNLIRQSKLQTWTLKPALF